MVITLPQGEGPLVQAPSSIRSRISSGELDREGAIELWAVTEPHAFILAELAARHVQEWPRHRRLVSLGCDGLKEYLLTCHLPNTQIDVVDIDEAFVEGLRRCFGEDRLRWGVLDLLVSDYSRFLGADGALLLQMDYMFSDEQIRNMAESLAKVPLDRLLVLSPSILHVAPRALVGYMRAVGAARKGSPRITYRRTRSRLTSLFSQWYREIRHVKYPLLNRPTWIFDLVRRRDRV